MSKVDAMRALREARRDAASTAATGAAPRSSARAAAPAPRRTASDRPAAAVEEICGHRNLGGRSCTREPDHVKNGTKSHRYG